MDDSLLIANTSQECELNIERTRELLVKMGFVINEDKSSCIPSKEILFLGFILNSENMTITLPVDKVNTIINLGEEIKNQTNIKDLLAYLLLHCQRLKMANFFIGF